MGPHAAADRTTDDAGPYADLMAAYLSRTDLDGERVLGVTRAWIS
jgi:hypothetical protein